MVKGKKQMQGKQSGFTLVELVVVIIILGVLSAVALPKFVNLSGEARNAAVKGVGAAASTGFAINYAARKASSAAAVGVTGTNATICAANGAGLAPVMTGGFPAGYSVIPGALTTSCATVGQDGQSGTCIVRDATLNSASATVTYICANP